jgi:hypothetical protein
LIVVKHGMFHDVAAAFLRAGWSNFAGHCPYSGIGGKFLVTRMAKRAGLDREEPFLPGRKRPTYLCTTGIMI